MRRSILVAVLALGASSLARAEMSEINPDTAQARGNETAHMRTTASHERSSMSRERSTPHTGGAASVSRVLSHNGLHH